ncbi:hypothetical protein XENOCAPTIV_011402, partial [Xenoophorus captivus]
HYSIFRDPDMILDVFPRSSDVLPQRRAQLESTLLLAKMPIGYLEKDPGFIAGAHGPLIRSKQHLWPYTAMITG